MQRIIYSIGVVWFAVALPVLGATHITNSVSLSANTGGNSASGSGGVDGEESQVGTVRTGKARSELSITTTVDGQVVMDVRESTTTDDGVSASLTKRVEVTSDGSGKYDIEVRGTLPQVATNTASGSSVLSGSSLEYATPSLQMTKSDDEVIDIISISSTTDASVLEAEVVSETSTFFTRVTQAVTNIFAYVVALFS